MHSDGFCDARRRVLQDVPAAASRMDRGAAQRILGHHTWGVVAMALVLGNEYSRDQILSELGVGEDQRDRAVLLDSGAVAAIVIKKNGVNPFNGKTYANALTTGGLVMQGENDDR